MSATESRPASSAVNAVRVAEITRRLQQALQPTALEVIDESHLHAGHAGARSGKGHFAVSVTSAAFVGKRSLARHRLVYAALGDYMTSDIHALSIKAIASGE